MRPDARPDPCHQGVQGPPAKGTGGPLGGGSGAGGRGGGGGPPRPRPRDRRGARGPTGLSNAELIALVWGTGAPGVSALDLATEALAVHGGGGGGRAPGGAGGGGGPGAR